MMHTQAGAPVMSYKLKPLGCDPQHVKGMSEKLIVSHYENNYGGALRRPAVSRPGPVAALLCVGFTPRVTTVTAPRSFPKFGSSLGKGTSISGQRYHGAWRSQAPIPPEKGQVP